MRARVGAATAIPLVFAALLAFPVSLIVVQVSLPLALGVGLILVVVIAAVVTNDPGG